MSLSGRIQATTVEKRDTPSMSIKVLGLRPGPGGQFVLAPLLETDDRKFNLRRLSVQSVEFGTAKGKSRTFLMRPETDMRLLVKASYVKNGKSLLWTVAFRSRPDDEPGRVLIPCGGISITALSGPLKRLHPEEAKVCFGAQYMPSTDLTPTAAKRHNIRISGGTTAVTPSIISTVDEGGTATTVSIRRRPRQIG